MSYFYFCLYLFFNIKIFLSFSHLFLPFFTSISFFPNIILHPRWFKAAPPNMVFINTCCHCFYEVLLSFPRNLTLLFLFTPYSVIRGDASGFDLSFDIPTNKGNATSSLLCTTLLEFPNIQGTNIQGKYPAAKCQWTSPSTLAVTFTSFHGLSVGSTVRFISGLDKNANKNANANGAANINVTAQCLESDALGRDCSTWPVSASTSLILQAPPAGGGEVESPYVLLSVPGKRDRTGFYFYC